MSVLDDYFNHQIDEATYDFVLSTLSPSCSREHLVSRLTDLMSRAKADPKVTKDLLAAAGWSTAVADLRQGRISVLVCV